MLNSLAEAAVISLVAMAGIASVVVFWLAFIMVVHIAADALFPEDERD